MMEKIFVICLYITLFYITCCVMSKHGSENSKPDKSWDRALRSGRDDEQSQAEMTPGQYCLCSKIYDPVCASNNESYFNLCYLECKVDKALNVSVIHQGNCIPY